MWIDFLENGLSRGKRGPLNEALCMKHVHPAKHHKFAPQLFELPRQFSHDR